LKKRGEQEVVTEKARRGKKQCSRLLSTEEKKNKGHKGRNIPLRYVAKTTGIGRNPAN